MVPRSLIATLVSALLLSMAKVCWFHSDFGVSTFVEYGKSVLVSSFNGEIFCFNREDDRISWKSNYLRKRGFTNNQDCKLRVDRFGNLFVVTTRSTFVKTNR